LKRGVGRPGKEGAAGKNRWGRKGWTQKKRKWKTIGEKVWKKTIGI